MFNDDLMEFRKKVEEDGCKLLSVIISNKTELLLFQCPMGHKFEQSFSNYMRGRRCSVCSGKKVIASTSFGYHFPDIAKQWNIVKNGKLTPFDVSRKSAKEVWWTCNKGHDWIASIANRSKGTGCPYCNGKKVLPEDSLGSLNPKLSIQWHSIKNGHLTPYDITPHSNKKVWWRCNQGHEWEATVSARFGSKSNKGTKCPYCSGSKLLVENSIVNTHSYLVEEWHPTKNKELTPDKVSFGSAKIIWWMCERGHSWKASCNNRSRGRNCPYCQGKKVDDKNSLSTLYPSLVKEWCTVENDNLTPNDVTVGSGRLVCWVCNNGHKWQARINKRTKGQGCPICKIYHSTSFSEQAIYYYVRKLFKDAQNRRIMQKESLCFEVDIYIPSINIAIEYDGGWHSDPGQIERDERKSKYLNQWKIQLVRIRSKGLPDIKEYGDIFIRQEGYKIEDAVIKMLKYLCVLNKEKNISDTMVDINRDAVAIYNMYLEFKQQNQMSDLYPNLRKEWHPNKNGNLSFNQFSSGSNKNFWWLCSEGHTWLASLNHRTDGSGCPFCKGKYVTDKNSLECLNPTLATEWHPTKNKKSTPSTIAVNSNKKVWWICSEGHEWEATVNNRNNSKGCPYCSGLLPTIKNNLIVVNPVVANQWHPSKNGKLKPSDFKPNSGKKAWWQCDNGHEWKAVIQSRNRGSGCPSCHNLGREKSK